MYALDAKAFVLFSVAFLAMVLPLCAQQAASHSLDNRLSERDLRVRYGQCEQYYVKQQWDLAAESLRDLVELSGIVLERPDSAERRRIQDIQLRAKRLLAEALMALERFEEAARLYGELFDGNYSPDTTRRSLFRRAEALYRIGDRQNARQLLEQYVHDYPDLDGIDIAYALPYLGDIAISEKQWKSARQWYSQALECAEIGPFAMRCQLGLGIAAEYMGDISEAQRSYDQVIASDVGEAKYTALFRRGNLAYKAGDRSTALACWRRVVHERPGSPVHRDAREAWGRGWFELAAEKQREEADTAVNDELLSLAREPLLSDTSWAARAYQRIGESLFERKEYDQALRAFLAVDATYANCPELQIECLERAAECYRRQGYQHSAEMMQARAVRKTKALHDRITHDRLMADRTTMSTKHDGNLTNRLAHDEQ